MDYLMYALNLSLVAAVLFGIMLYIHDRAHIDPAFLPLMTISVITVLVYLGGLIGWLLPITILIYLGGIVALIYEIVRIVRAQYSPDAFIKSPSVWMFLIFLIYFVFRMKGMQVLHVDNFSHWATIIKEMCMTDAFPVENTAITFRNYTPGCASFIYFVCKAVTFTEGHALMAQGIITSSALATLFCRVKFHHVAAFLSLIATAVLTISSLELLSASLGIYNFLVDDLLAYITVACGIIIFAYRQDFKKCLTVLIPALGMLTIIKSSARIFAILLTIFVVFVFIKKIFLPKKLIGLILLIGTQVLLPSFYNLYTSHTFPTHTDKFSSDIGGLFSTLISKKADDLKNIATAMIKEMTDLSFIPVKLILSAIVFALTVSLICLILRKKPHIILPALLCTMLTLIFYIIELFILYGFIFDESEASVLASFYRYFSTGTIIVVMTLFPASIYQLHRIAGEYQCKRWVITAFSVIMILSSITPVMITSSNAIQLLFPHIRQETKNRLQERNYYSDFYSGVTPIVPPDSSVLIYTENKSFFARTLPGYELMTENFAVIHPADLQDDTRLKELMDRQEYVVVEGNTDQFHQAIRSIDYKLHGENSTVYAVDAAAKTLTAVD